MSLPADESAIPETTSRQIRSVAVLGCGTMGAGIAAVSAAAGCRVLMLDLTEEAAQRGLATVKEENRHLVEVGTFDVNLPEIKDYDWICEAIVEDLATKRELFAKVEPLRREGSVISSNTSGIPLRGISEGMPLRFRQDVAITHFFNPVQVMKLFELVPGEDTTEDVIRAFTSFGTKELGKGVVNAKDTVNFIGNRIGCFLMLSGLHLAKPFLLEGMTQEAIDAVLGHPVGLPPTGLYGLIDLIGLDIMDLVGKNLDVNLPEGDIGRAYTSFPEVEQRMLERGQLGRKSRSLGGFGRVQKLEDGSKKKETFDLLEEEWRPASAPVLGPISEHIGEVLFDEGLEGELAWQVIGGTLRYAANLIPEISDDVVNIDRAIRWGFAWSKGPFELMDAVGPLRIIEKIEAEGGEVPVMLRVLRDAGAASFYRIDGTEFLGLDGMWHLTEEV